MSQPKNAIIIKGARVNNLKNIDVEIPKNKLVVVTGLSGSGKSSLAFDTIYAEGQRQYLDSLSSYARQFVGVMDKPDVDQIEGLSPVISIDQKTTSNNPRSTVGTITEIYDYLRLLFAKAGTMHDPKTGNPLKQITIKDIMFEVLKLPEQTRIIVAAPVVVKKKGKLDAVIKKMKKANFHQVRLDEKQYAIDDLANVHIDEDEAHDIDVVVDYFFTERIRPEKMDQSGLYKAIKSALELANGLVKIVRKDNGESFIYSQHLFNAETGEYLPEIELRSFSFNSPYGACPHCTGLGIVQDIDEDLIIFNPKLSIAEGAIKAWTRLSSNQPQYQQLIEEVAKVNKINLGKPVKELSADKIKLILRGTGEVEYEIKAKKMKFEGIIPFLEKKYKESDSEYIKTEIGEYMAEKVCPACTGKRLKPESLAVTFDSKSIAELVNMDLE